MSDITLSPYAVQLLGDAGLLCLSCARPEAPRQWLCERCHERTCAEATTAAIEDAIKEAK